MSLAGIGHRWASYQTHSHNLQVENHLYVRHQFLSLPLLEEKRVHPRSQNRILKRAGIALHAHFVGTSDHTLSRSLSAQFNRREGHLHLCISRPCTEAEEGFLHVVRLKVYTRGNFNAPYYTAARWASG